MYTQSQIQQLLKVLGNMNTGGAGITGNAISDPDPTTPTDNKGLLSVVKSILGIKDDETDDDIATGLIKKNKKRSALLNLGGQSSGLLGMGGEDMGLLAKLKSLF